MAGVLNLGLSVVFLGNGLQLNGSVLSVDTSTFTYTTIMLQGLTANTLVYVDGTKTTASVTLDSSLTLTAGTLSVTSGGGLPSQTGNSGKVLTTNGTTASWTSSTTALNTITSAASTNLVLATTSFGTAVTITSATGAITLAAALSGTSATFSSLTSGRVPFASTGGLLTDASTFTFAAGTLTLGTGVSTVSGTFSSLTSGRVTFASTAGLLADSSSLTYNSGTGALSATSFVGAGTSLTGIVYALSGTSGQIVASAATGNVTLSLPTAITGVNSLTSAAASALTFGTGTFGTAITVASATGATTFSAGVSGTTASFSTSITTASLTAGRVTFAGTAGILSDSASLTFNSGTGALSATSFIGSGSSLTGIVTSITGTAGQVVASAATGAVTLSLAADVTNVNSLTSTALSNLSLGTGTSGTAITVLSASNYVGIGTTSPEGQLHLGAANNTWKFWNTATTATDAFGSTIASINYVKASFSGVPVQTNSKNLFTWTDVQGSSGSYVGHLIQTVSPASNGNNLTNIQSLIVQTQHTGTGTVNALQGINSNATLAASAGAATSLSGGTFSATVSSTAGVSSNINGLSVAASNLAAGTVATRYGVILSNLTNSGTITNTYGLYIGSVTAGTQTNAPYSIYASDAAAQSYFAGPVNAANTTASTSTTTGALIVGGGVGVAGDIVIGNGKKYYIGSTNISWTGNSGTGVMAIDNYSSGSGFSFQILQNGATPFAINTSNQVQVATATASTSTTTGALTVAGGLGVAGAIYGGGTGLALYSLNTTVFSGQATLFLGQTTPSTTNYQLTGDATTTYLNGSSNISLRVANGAVITASSSAVSIVQPVTLTNTYLSITSSGSNSYMYQGTGWMWTSDGTSAGTQRAVIFGDSSGALNLRSSGNTQSLAISGGASATLTGGAGNMTIVAGTGASRTLTLQTTTSGSTATNGLVIDAAQQVQVPASTASTSTSTGALVVTGGVGIGGQATVGSISSPGSGTNSQRFGVSASTSTYQGATAVGASASVTGDYGTAVGTNSAASGTSIGIGYGATVTTSAGATVVGFNSTVTSADYAIVIGQASSATTGAGSTITMGRAVSNAYASYIFGFADAPTASGQLIFSGGGLANIGDVYFGRGVTNSATAPVTLQPSGRSGADLAGNALTLAGGKATGNAAGGAILFQTSDAGSTGSTLQSLTTKMTLSSAGNLTVSGSITSTSGALIANSLTSAAGSALTLATGTSGTALSIASATNAVTITSTGPSAATQPLSVYGGTGEGVVAKFNRAASSSEKAFYIGNTQNTHSELSSEGEVWLKAGVTADTPFSSGTTALKASTTAVTVPITTSSTSTTTGSLVNAGGFGNAGAIYAGNLISSSGSQGAFQICRRDTSASAWLWYSSAGSLQLYDAVNAVDTFTVTPGALSAAVVAVKATTASSSATTGALTVAGGLGVAGRINAGDGVVALGYANSTTGYGILSSAQPLAFTATSGTSTAMMLMDSTTQSSEWQLRFARQRSSSYTLSTADSAGAISWNTVTFLRGQSTSAVTGGFSTIDLYISAYNAAGTYANRFKFSAEGDLSLLSAGGNITMGNINTTKSIYFSQTATDARLESDGYGFSAICRNGQAVYFYANTALMAYIDHGSGRFELGRTSSSTGYSSNGAWLTNIAANNVTFTDTNSSGTVAFRSLVTFNQQTIAASSATTYTDTSNLYLDNAPGAGTNVTITNAWSLYSAGRVKIASTTASTSSTTGALVVSGGAGFAKDIYVQAIRIGYGSGGAVSNTIVGAFDISGAGSENTMMGYGIGGSLSSGNSNTVIGFFAGRNMAAGSSNNVLIGQRAGLSTTGDSNVMLGRYAGGYETGSNSFYVDNQDRTNTAGDKAGALLYGTFNATASSQTLTVNARLTTSAGHAYKVSVLTSNTTLDATYHVVVANSATPFAITLPSGATTGQSFMLKNKGSATVTVSGNGSNVFGAASAATVPMQSGESFIASFDGTVWVLI